MECEGYTVTVVSEFTVKALYFVVFSMHSSSLEFNFADFELLHRYNALPKRLRGIQFNRNSSFTKFKAFTVVSAMHMYACVGVHALVFINQWNLHWFNFYDSGSP